MDHDSPLRNARKARGLSIGIVADDLGIPKTTLQRIETGTAPVIQKDRARALYEYFNREVPLAAIYDPELAANNDH